MDVLVDDGEDDWISLTVGGLNIATKTDGTITKYTVSDTGMQVVLSNVFEGLASVDVNVEHNTAVMVASESFRAGNTEDDHVYLAFGLQPADGSDEFDEPVLEIRLHRAVAAYIFAALFAVFGGEINDDV